LSIFFMCGGHTGLLSSQGSVTMRFPPGLVMMNVAWPSHVIESFDIRPV
jgi:hypothetical protein